MLSILTAVAQSSRYYTSSYDYTPASTTSDSISAGVVLVIFLVALFVSLLAYLFFALCYYKIFKKAKVQNTWAAFIPIYNNWVLYELAGRPGWWALLVLIPGLGSLIGLIVSIIALIDVAKSFGKDVWYAVLLIVVPIIGFPMLAFGGAQYQGPAGPEGQTPATPTPPVSPTAPQPPVVG